MAENDDDNILEDVVDFLKKSSAYYSGFVARKKRDLEIYSGNYWNDATRKKWKRSKRRCLAVDNWSVLCNAIVSPLSNSPWHCQLKDLTDESMNSLQDVINKVEFDSDSKRAYQSAMRNAALLGTGFLVVTTIEKNDGVHIVLENVQDISRVAMDPTISTTSGKDSEECALVSQMSVKKAKRLYGDDIVPLDYPRAMPILSHLGDQWADDPEQVKVVTYYRKVDDGVMYYKLCGNKVVEKQMLPISTIPVLRLTGYEVFRDNKFDWIGVVDKTYALQTITNIAFSTMAERMNRAPRANFIANIDAVDGLEEYYKRIQDDDAMLALYKGEHIPQPIKEAYETSDLVATIQNAQSLIESTVGIPLTGINGITKVEQTATEILSQQNALESNVSVFYDAAYEVQKAVGSIIIEMLTGGECYEFELENGPDLITRNMRKQRELAALLPLIPEEMKGLVAKYYADTMESSFADSLADNIVANLPPTLKLIADKGETDPYAIHQMQQYQAQVDEAMAQLEAVNNENAELKKQLEQMNQSLMSQREKMLQDWKKFVISEQDRVNLETAKLEQAGQIDASKIALENDKLKLEGAKELAELQQKHDEEMIQWGSHGI